MIIVLEGGDQAGKKTQTRMLLSALRKSRIPAASFEFPDYSTPIGAVIRRYLEGRKKIDPLLIHHLMSANRWEKADRIKKACKEHPVVIMNRYWQSNLVYGTVNGVDRGLLEYLDRGLPEADLVLVLDIDPGVSFQRKRTGRDRFERDASFAVRVASAYRTMAKKMGWRIIDASGSPEKTHQDIMKLLKRKLGRLA